MITVKLGELRSIVEGLNEIMGERLPIKAAYGFGKLAKKIQKEIEVYEEQRMALLERYCARDDKGKPVMLEGNRFKIADPEGFGKDFLELANIETEIDFNSVILESLGEIKASPIALIKLEKFIVE